LKLGRIVRAVPDLNDAVSVEAEVKALCDVERQPERGDKVGLGGNWADHRVGVLRPAGFRLRTA
jgi:hypothetical protein